MPSQAHVTFQAGSTKIGSIGKPCGFKEFGEEVYGRARDVEANIF